MTKYVVMERSDNFTKEEESDYPIDIHARSICDSASAAMRKCIDLADEWALKAPKAGWNRVSDPCFIRRGRYSDAGVMITAHTHNWEQTWTRLFFFEPVEV